VRLGDPLCSLREVRIAGLQPATSDAGIVNRQVGEACLRERLAVERLVLQVNGDGTASRWVESGRRVERRQDRVEGQRLRAATVRRVHKQRHGLSHSGPPYKISRTASIGPGQ